MASAPRNGLLRGCAIAGLAFLVAGIVVIVCGLVLPGQIGRRLHAGVRDSWVIAGTEDVKLVSAAVHATRRAETLCEHLA